jgi:hypothetical protein
MSGTQGPTGASEPTDNRRVIRLPRATRLLAAWLVCIAVAFAVVWFSPLGIEHAPYWTCPTHVYGDPINWCSDPVTRPARQFALPILVLRAAVLGTVLWVAYLGVRAVRSRVRFKVG